MDSPLPSTRHLQSTARLALLAMFLLLAAPLFSQALAAAAPAPAWLSEMACGAGDHHPSSHEAPSWAQCGYCTLLLSSPALGMALPGHDGAAPFATPLPWPLRLIAPGEPVTRHDAPPRAPPPRPAPSDPVQQRP